jgi:hypothetical protein
VHSVHSQQLTGLIADLFQVLLTLRTLLHCQLQGGHILVVALYLLLELLLQA